MQYNCQGCNSIAPSQLKEPLIISKTPEYPFQYICADYFEIKGNQYLTVVDRFSSWIMICHFLPTKLNHQSLIDTCRALMVVQNSLHTSSKIFCTSGVCKHKLSSQEIPSIKWQGWCQICQMHYI